MKLRIKGDSLRLRLTRGEVSQLDTTGTVEDRVRFGVDAALVYRVCSDPGIGAMSASFAGAAVEVRVPAAAIRHWAGSSEVTLAGTQPLSTDDALRIMVEKDFACLAPREGEDESDHFEHPAAHDGKTC